MKSTFDFSRLERNTWMIIYENGLIDIMIGLIYVIAVFCSLFDKVRYFLYPLFLLPAVLYVFAWRRIIIPRLGVIHFNQSRKRKNRILYIAITLPLVLLVGLRLFTPSIFGSGGTGTMLAVGAVILIIFFSIAYVLDFTRMYVYGILVTALFFLGEALRPYPHLSLYKEIIFLPAALLLIGTGCFLLNRFLREHPLPDEGARHDQ